ncbi:ribosome small subunit-dependent GTPase A [Thermophagus xiamenensis]|uniref:Small ribosomal subunit biogenesis GTPase RsgA n=1 Tax=Thermophagus xiamenensis TaxID=385682 RepID=A0A1I2E5N9_9BACT|nr:ribosome small subunit-dependent GTPase A [Thermophagus xiamenensis]SFE87600.1 ribosome biogenesis GTPase [Thermophagus xiamenensis]
MKEGLVIKSTGSWYLVKSDDERPVSCKIKGRFRLNDIKSTNPVAVGDRVIFSVDEKNGIGIIEEILERKNYIVRRASNLSRQTQILAANIDQAILVATINYPVTTPVFIDRFLATTEAYDIPTTIIFNKIDRYDHYHKDQLKETIQIYNNIGYNVLVTSAKHDQNIDLVRELLKNKVSLLAGHSGVGKSTLINRVEPTLNLKTAKISDAHNTGRHTTTFTEMHPLGIGGYIIDTPGIRGFGLFNIKKEELAHFFREIFKFSSQCRYHNCTHLHEPGCAVKDAVEKGNIALSRYNSYVRIFLNRDEKFR